MSNPICRIKKSSAISKFLGLMSFLPCNLKAINMLFYSVISASVQLLRIKSINNNFFNRIIFKLLTVLYTDYVTLGSSQ